MKLAEKLRQPLVVNEYGSWVMFSVPLLGSTLLFTNDIIKLVLLCMAALSAFLLYRPVEILLIEYWSKRNDKSKTMRAEFWMMIYGTCSSALGFVLILVYNLSWLILIAAGAAAFFLLSQILSLRYKSALLRDITAIFGLSLIAPAVEYTFTKNITMNGMLLGMLNALFFISSAFFVHMKMVSKKTDSVKQSKMFRTRMMANIIFQVSLLILLVISITVSLQTAWILPAFLPIIIHALAGTFAKGTAVNLRRTGVIFVLYSVNFLVFMAIFFLSCCL